MKLRIYLFSVLGLALLGILAWSRIKPPLPPGHPAASNRNTKEVPKSAAVTAGQALKNARVAEAYGRLPLNFEANFGQTDARVKYLSRGSGYTLFLSGDEAVLALRSQKPASRNSAARPPGPESRTPDALRLKLVGANPSAKVIALDELPGKVNYFTGNNPKKWRTDVPTYAKVKYEGVYPGVDLVYYGNQGKLEYDFVVAPGADPKAIELAAGAGLVPARGRPQGPPLRIDAGGDLVIATSGGEVRLHRPVVYQPATSNPSSVVSCQLQKATGDGPRANDALNSPFIIQNSKFVVDGNRIRFEIPNYDRTKPLVIDPTLTYSTYLGGLGDDTGFGIAVDSSGNAYITGNTSSADFPTMAPLQAANAGSPDAFVTKLNAAGTALVYSTYLGGTGGDFGQGIAVDSSGNATVTGYTGSTDFPLANAFQTANGGVVDAFVTQLNSTGSALVYSTYLGGNGGDQGYGIAVDSSGNAVVAGATGSTNFPTINPLFAANAGGTDAFVAKLNWSGTALTLVYSTYLGGSGEDTGRAISLDSSGDAFVTGDTGSTDFPNVNALQTANAGGTDAFAAELNSTGSALVYSTYLGGSGGDFGKGIALDTSNNTYVIGFTSSADFPLANPIQGTCGGCANGFNDAFVSKLNFNGTTLALTYSTFLGGSNNEFGYGIAVDSSGNAYVTGRTESADFPTMNPFQFTIAGSPDAFLAKINPAGSALIYSTYLGGGKADISYGIAVDSSGSAYLTGRTESTDFPTVNPIQAATGGVGDVFVAKVTTPPVGLTPQTLAFGGQIIGTTSNTRTVTVTNDSGTALTINSFSVTGDFAVASSTSSTACSASSPVPSGTLCTIDITFSPTVGGSSMGTLTVMDSDATSPQTATLTGTGTQDFAVSIAAGGSSSATVKAGTPATYTLSVAPLGGFNQTVMLNCTGVPFQANCLPTPNPFTLNGTTPQSVTVTVNTTARGGTGPSPLTPFEFPPWGRRLLPLLWIVALFVLAASLSRRRSRASDNPWVPAFPGTARKLLAPALLALVLATMLAWAACNAYNTRPPGTPAGTYPLTVTGSAGTLSHSVSLTLTVN